MSRRILPGRRTLVAAFVLGAIALRASGDTLADLRRVLARYPATTPLSVSATVQVNGAARGGSSTFDAEFGPAGFTLRLSPDALQGAEDEAAAKKRDPNAPTPTRSAMVALTVFDVMDALDGAAMLLDDLSGATLIDQTASVHNGKQASLLRIKVKPSLATQSRLVHEPKIELRVWTGADGVPIAAERDSDYSASFLFLKAGNSRKESWEFAVRGDRLYASRNDETDRASAGGKSIVTSRSVVYSPK